MENLLTSLKVKCVEADTNLTEVCRRAGIARSTVDRWERKLPKSFELLQKLNDTVDRIKIEKQSDRA